MEAYLTEKKKVQSFLLVGVGLAVIFLIFTMINYGFSATLRDIFQLDSLILLIAIICYPLGIVYGWRQMLGMIGYTAPHQPADRYYTASERLNYKNGRIMGWVLKLALVICFGWIFGTIAAFKNLHRLKSQK